MGLDLTELLLMPVVEAFAAEREVRLVRLRSLPHTQLRPRVALFLPPKLRQLQRLQRRP